MCEGMSYSKQHKNKQGIYENLNLKKHSQTKLKRRHDFIHIEAAGITCRVVPNNFPKEIRGQWEKVLAAEPSDLSSVPRTHGWKESALQLSCDPHPLMLAEARASSMPK